jgi:hypothetical protein
MSNQPMVTDQRYNIGLEFTGAPTQQHVVRFCGDFISAHEGRGEAEIAALTHAIDREQNHSAWQLVTKVENVIWIRNGSRHRVAYGADIKNFKGKHGSFEASQCFGACVHHALACEGLI